ncbi:pantoate--beta-alanine ligase [Flavobacteriaceae bacterium D16]|nr:pantoate--beta-alanine ligase [Flavobacteriaceae bacterium D16]
MTAIYTRAELRNFLEAEKAQSRQIGLVPTMGALHQGHLSLVEKAIQENDRVIVSIFVNPTQFNNQDDLDTYPQNLEADLDLLKPFLPKVVVFAPSIEEMYTDRVKAENYDLGGLDHVMEGAHRKGHFEGVATIVETLLRTTSPDRAYFGEKDYQQLLIIKKLIRDKGLDVTICHCPIVREPNGLAMSSRNSRLPKRLRERAGIIFNTLQSAKKQFGTKSVTNIEEWVEEVFRNEPDFELEYFSISDANTLIPVDQKHINKEYRAFIAVYAGDTRLIDNLALN